MPAWIPILKAALPYVSSIVAAAVPVFTSRKDPDGSTELVARQIAELQEAVTGNAETVRGLAAQMEQTIQAIDVGAADLSQRLAALQESLARCESMSSLAQAQVTRLEAALAVSQAQGDAIDRQLAAGRRREVAITSLAALAMVVALVALLSG